MTSERYQLTVRGGPGGGGGGGVKMEGEKAWLGGFLGVPDIWHKIAPLSGIPLERISSYADTLSVTTMRRVDLSILYISLTLPLCSDIRLLRNIIGIRIIVLKRRETYLATSTRDFRSIEITA